MHVKSLSLAATLLPLVSGYPITADDVKCRAGPSTTEAIVRSFAVGTDVDVTCQTTGEAIFGHNIWNRVGTECYVSDYYVDTGSNEMVEPQCDDGGGGGGGDSEYNGPISRKEIMARGDYWIQQGIPYSMERTEPDQNGRQYRTDCSGFVAMAYHATSPGANTVSLPEIAEAINWEDLKEGDMVGTLGEGTGGANGHVVLFKSWIDDSMQEFNTIECKGTDGCVAWTRAVNYPVGSFLAKPYRYIQVTD